MCRKELTQNELESLENKENDCIEDLVIWVRNPVTKRKIKKGGKTYRQLIEDGIILEID
jgi:hypothetical protein